MFMRSLDRHLNSTAVRGPENEGGADEGILDTGGDVGDSGSDAGGSVADGEGGEAPPEKLTVREQIKKSIAETSDPPKGKEKRDPKTGRFGERAPKGQEAAPAKEAVAGAEPEAPAADAIPAPARLSAEAKAKWAETPPEIQQAFIKSEQDMTAGVEQLKQRYNLIDQAIAPHAEKLRQMNATPADAVDRMFQWFGALAGSPANAFPALAKSMGIDWDKLIAPQTPGALDQQTAAQGTVSGTPPEIPEPVKNYVGQLEQRISNLTNMLQQFDGRFGSVEQNLNTQNEARTRENLSIWSKDKTHFEEVRQDMAKLIETGVIPLKADGQVDLDTAYERAIYFNPDVRKKVLAEQQQANQQVQQQSKEAATTAQQTQVAKARKAAVSLPVTSPGDNKGLVPKKKPGQKLSVRESLKAAVAELRDQ